MARNLSGIGDNRMLKELASQTDINNTTISLILDKPRTLAVHKKIRGKSQLIIRCQDIDDRAIILLYLPYNDTEPATAIIIDSTESTGA